MLKYKHPFTGEGSFTAWMFRTVRNVTYDYYRKNKIAFNQSEVSVVEYKLEDSDSISSYVQDIPVSWRNIQIKHLLTHSSGLPDMSPFITFEKLTENQAKKRVFDKPIRFSPGKK